VNVVSCFVRKGKRIEDHFSCGFDLDCLLVEFWSSNCDSVGPLLSVEIHIPLLWGPHIYLCALENSH